MVGSRVAAGAAWPQACRLLRPTTLLQPMGPTESAEQTPSDTIQGRQRDVTDTVTLVTSPHSKTGGATTSPGCVFDGTCRRIADEPKSAAVPERQPPVRLDGPSHLLPPSCPCRAAWVCRRRRVPCLRGRRGRGSYLSYSSNRSECVPVRDATRTSRSWSTAYTSSQSGRTWHSRKPS